MNQNSIQPFPKWFTDHHLDEPAYGFLARHLDTVKVASPHAFYSSLGHKGGGVSALSIKTVAEFTRCDLKRLERSSPSSKGGSRTVLGETVGYGQFTTAFRKFCPECLSEHERHHRFMWDLHAVTCCPLHKVALRDKCDCGRRVTWRNSHIRIALCGCELDELRATRSPHDDELAFATYIAGRLSSGPRIRHQALDDLDLESVIAAIENLGRYRLAPHLPLREAITAHGHASIVAAGYAVASDLKTEYWELLEAVITSPVGGDDAKRWGLGAAYGEFRQWLSRLPDNSELKVALHRGMEANAKAHSVVFSKSAKTGSGRRIAVSRFNLLEAADYCRVPYKRIREVAVRLGYMEADKGKGTPVRLSKAAMKEISLIVSDRVLGKTLAQQLGIDRHAVGRMRRAGFIESFGQETGRGVTSEGSEVWTSFSSDCAQRLIDSLEPLVVPDRSKDLSPIPIAAKNLRCSIVRIVAYALAGKLHFRGVDDTSRGLARLLVSRSELRRLAYNDHPDGTSLAQAGRDLKYNRSTLPQMREAGLVQVTSIGGCHRIGRKELERIRATYIVASEIMVRYNVPREPLAMTHLLRNLGVYPFCERPKFHQFVYLRAEVDAKLRDYVRCAATPRIDQPMTMGEARKALHILSSKFAAALRESGHLRADKKG